MSLVTLNPHTLEKTNKYRSRKSQNMSECNRDCDQAPESQKVDRDCSQDPGTDKAAWLENTRDVSLNTNSEKAFVRTSSSTPCTYPAKIIGQV